MPTFIVWKPDHAETPTDGGMKVVAHNAEDAALERAELRFSDDEYPSEQTLAVQDEAGAISLYQVFAESVPSFSAFDLAHNEDKSELNRAKALIAKYAAEETAAVLQPYTTPGKPSSTGAGS
jgi:hypothetical protein